MHSILHIITRLDVGGSAENTLLTVIGLAKRGYHVALICGRSDNPQSENEQKAIDAGVRIIRLKRLVRDVSPVSDIIALIQLYRHICARRYDLIHTHTSKAGALGRIAAYLARAKCVVHTPHGHIFYGYFSFLLTRVFVWVERFLMRWTGMQITLTQNEKDDYLAHGIGPANKMAPIYSGIELEPYLNCACDRDAIRTELGCSKEHFIAGTVARLVPIKNHALIVQAACQIHSSAPDMRFVFVGDGELRQSLENEINHWGLSSRFIFAGWRSDIPQLLSSFDLFVMCSKNEGMGRAFVEAQACGVPAIGSRVGGIAEVLSEGKTGCLVSPSSAKQLAEKLQYLYDNPDVLADMAENCKPWVRKRFSAETMIEKIEGIYRKMLGGMKDWSDEVMDYRNKSPKSEIRNPKFFL